MLPPGCLAILELFHAHGHHDAVCETLKHQIDQWMLVHYLQLILFPLTAWSVYQMTANYETSRSRFRTAALAIFGLGYAAYDSIAGIGSGILVKNSIVMADITGVPVNFDAICAEIIQSYYHSPFAANIARVAIAAAISGFVLTAITLWEKGYGWFPVLMLAGACWGVTKTHAPPYGPITYGFVFAAAAAVAFFAPQPPQSWQSAMHHALPEAFRKRT